MEPYINRTQFRLSIFGGLLIVAGLLLGAVFSWWLSRELQKLRNYALSVSKGERAEIQQSKIASGELRQLATALESMRAELEGKNYIENYVQTLTHELKSPLAGIRAAAEVLQSPMTEEQRKSFLNNIDIESQRLQQLIDRLLNLAKIEHQQSLHQPVSVNMTSLISEVIKRYELRMQQKNIQLDIVFDQNLEVIGEIFLLEQAISNLLDNALDFTPNKGAIKIQLSRVGEQIIFSLFNQGAPIPDFAITKLTDRFFSLPRPETGKKSTGLGLNFVQEIMKLHKGRLEINNVRGGISTKLIFRC
jgi:two-component system sensor histidine kinase CreC